MRLYSSKVPTIARDIIRTLTQNAQIEVSNAEEAQLDVEAVLKEYLRQERELTDQAKDVMEKRKMSHGEFSRIKRSLAEERAFPLGEEGIVYICNQVLETFMHSAHVEEVFASDVDMRREMKEILRVNMLVDEELDAEVRQRIKNLTEGSTSWDVEYSKVMEQIKVNRGIKE